jgi:guanylate kinase
MGTGHVFIVSGPSGAGKGTIVSELKRRLPHVWVSVSATTRPPRPSEADGVDYFFLTANEFEARVRAGEFLEHAEVHGNRYGSLRGPIERRLFHGMDVILEIDPQGAFQVREHMPGARLIFVKAPDSADYEKRIRNRGAESDEEIRTRMQTARRELELEDTYDHVVLNDDVSRAVDDVVAYMRSVSKPNTKES